MARKEKMSKMKMPEAPSGQDEMLELDELEMEMEPEGEEMEMEGEMESPLADFSDEELMAEVEARGLSLEPMDESEDGEEMVKELDEE